MDFDQDFINGLKKRPETYLTILKDNFDNRNTITNVVRKKIGRLVEYGFIGAGILPGTRFGMRIFYNFDKEYSVISVRHHQLFHYYYCKEMREENEESNNIILKECYELKETQWIECGDLIISNDSIVRWF